MYCLEQMLLKTDFPLRSRQNVVDENGTLGLCLYLDLEQENRRRRKEQIEAARRQHAADRAEVEVSALKEGEGTGTCASYDGILGTTHHD